MGECVISLVLSHCSKNLKWCMDQCYSSVTVQIKWQTHVTAWLQLSFIWQAKENTSLRREGRLTQMKQREAAIATAKSLQLCPILCKHIDGSPPGSPVPGILQARTLEWVAIFFSNAWKWKVKVKSLSRVWLLATPWTAAYQAPLSMGFSRQEYWSGLPFPSPAKRGFCLLFVYVFTPPPEPALLNWISQEGHLFHLRFSLWSLDLPLFYSHGLFPFFVF